MKNLFYILAIVSAFIGGTEIASAQYWDDLYIRPSTRDEIKQLREKQAEQERAEAEKKRAETEKKQAEAESAYVPDSLWDTDAYNRRYEIPEETAYDQETVAETEAEDANQYTEDEGYYLNGFYGTQSDLEYAERIRKFHNPRFTVHITDPAYTEIYFLNSYNWNVYIDGTYAYVTPTWTNPMYWDYMWSPYSYWGPSWRWSSYYWGWGYPYYGFGWSWGYPYYPYYPHYPHYVPGHRPPHRPDYRPTPSQRPSYSPGGWSSRRPGTSTSVTRPSGTNSNRVITNSQNQRVRLGNTSRSSQRQSSTRQIETQRNNYNRSYTPSYNSNSSRGSSISSGSSGSSRGSIGGSSRGGTSGGSRSRR